MAGRKTIHDMSAGAQRAMRDGAVTVSVWNREALKATLNQDEGVLVSRNALQAIGTLFGIEVYSDPALPDGRIEFRNPDGSIAYRFDLK